MLDFPGRATGATRPPRGRRPRGLARSISPRTGPGAGTSSARGHAGGRRGTPGKRCSSGQLSDLMAVLLWLWLPNHSSHRPQTLGPLQEVPIWDSRPATAARAPLDGAQPTPPRGGPVERKIGARPPIATSSVPPMRPPLLSPRSCLENACARRIRGATSHVRLRAAPTYTEFGAVGFVSHR